MRGLQQATDYLSAFWARWRRWEYRYQAIWLGIMGLLLLIYAWFLFTGSIARRH